MLDQFGLKEDEASALKMPENHPARRGITALFSGIHNGEVLELTAPSMSSEQRHYAAGRLAMLAQLEGFLEIIYEGDSAE